MSVDELRVAMAAAFALFLVLLRLDAQHLGAAEYDELDERGHRPPFRRRLAWYAVGIGLVALTYLVHPDPERVLHLRLGTDRLQALTYGLAFGALGIVQAIVFASLRYGHALAAHGLPLGRVLPPVRAYPGAILNAVGTALVDEGAFRGVLLGMLVATSLPGDQASLIQGLVYVLATRVAAPGRDRYTLVLTLVLGLGAGWVTLQTGGIGAAVIGHAVTRLAMFAMTGHAGMVAAKGHDPVEVAVERLPPRGWEVVEEE